MGAPEKTIDLLSDAGMTQAILVWRGAIHVLDKDDFDGGSCGDQAETTSKDGRGIVGWRICADSGVMRRMAMSKSLSIIG
jgi:hypothetical protein